MVIPFKSLRSEEPDMPALSSTSFSQSSTSSSSYLPQTPTNPTAPSHPFANPQASLTAQGFAGNQVDMQAQGGKGKNTASPGSAGHYLMASAAAGMNPPTVNAKSPSRNHRLSTNPFAVSSTSNPATTIPYPSRDPTSSPSSSSTGLLSHPQNQSPSSHPNPNPMTPPMSHSSSLTGSVITASSASPGSPARRTQQGEVLSVEMALRNAGGDLERALRMVVDERNSFATQNAQLWKMVEKRQTEKTGLREDLSRATKRINQLEDEISDASGSGSQVEDREGTVTNGSRSEGRKRAGTVVSRRKENSSLERPAQPARSYSDQLGRMMARQDSGGRESPTPEIVVTGGVRQGTLSRIQSVASSGSEADVEMPMMSGSKSGSSLETPVVGRDRLSRDNSYGSEETDETPTYRNTRKNLLPSPPIINTPTTSDKRSKAVSRMAFDPEVKDYLQLAATPSPGKDAFPSIPGPSRVNSQPVEESLRTETPQSQSALATPPPMGQDTLPVLMPASPLSDIGIPSSSASTAETDDMPASVPVMPSASKMMAKRQDSEASDISSTSSPVKKPEVRPVLSNPELSPTHKKEHDVHPARSRQQSADAAVTMQQNPGKGGFKLPGPPERRPKMGQHSSSTTSNGNIPGMPRLRLVPKHLPYARCTIPSSRIIPNSLGKEALSFIISVQLRPPGDMEIHTWNVAKFFSSFVDLDTKIRSKMSKRAIKAAGLAGLPDGKGWKDYAPSMVDRRKASLEAYIQSLLASPLEDKTDICTFLQTDVISGEGEKTPGMPKSGYLTKRGKNFGGWKTRFFVLDGPALHYYEQRGGPLLGSIPVVRAKIGKQHKDSASDANDEKAYRHAFLLIEPSNTGGPAPVRHVLCAESDEDRDAWVEALMKHVGGDFEETTRPSTSSSTRDDIGGLGGSFGPPGSLKSTPTIEIPSRKASMPTRQSSKDDAGIVKTGVQPLNTLPVNDSTAKLFNAGPSPAYINSRVSGGSAMTSPIEVKTNYFPSPNKGGPMSPDMETSSSLPIHLEAKSASLSSLADIAEGTDSDNTQTTPARQKRQSMIPARLQKVNPETSRAPAVSSNRVQTSHNHTSSIEKDASRIDRGQISRPSGGVAIPQGYQFGSKEVPKEGTDRGAKAKSRLMWGFSKSSTQPAALARPVFGVPLRDSLEVASVAGLPAIVFRCIKYLESQRAHLEEGIFRLSGSSNLIKGLKDKFNAEGDFDLLANDKRWDLHAIAGLLKLYMRECPSVLTTELHMHFLAVTDLWETKVRITELTRLVNLLPIENYTLLRALVGHFVLICSHASTNKMTVRNIGIVIAPSMYIPAGIISDLIQQHRAIFEGEPIHISEPDPVKPAEPDAAVSEQAVEPENAARRLVAGEKSGRGNRNSIIYSATSDPLLGSVGRELTETQDSQGEAESENGELLAMEEEDDDGRNSSFAGSPVIEAPLRGRDTFPTDQSYRSSNLASPLLASTPPISPSIPHSPRFADALDRT